MKEAKVIAIVNREVKKLRAVLALQKWRLIIDYGEVGDDLGGRTSSANCRVNPGAHRMWITFDPEKFESEEEVVEILRHELLHIFHAELLTMFEMMSQFITDSQTQNTMEVQFQFVCEAIDSRVETMLDIGLGLDTKKLLRIAEKKYGYKR